MCSSGPLRTARSPIKRRARKSPARPAQKSPVKPYGWSAEMTEIGKALWWKGVSSAEIAHRLKLSNPRMVSRKAYRDDWVRNVKVIKVRPPPQGAPRPPFPPLPIPDVQHRDDEPPPYLHDGVPFTMRTIPNGRCRWIPGEPSGDTLMCGHLVYRKSRWCEYHHRRCYP
jgi:hypothetical protein